MRYQALTIAALMLVACTPATPATQKARLRTQAPSTCTDAQANACPVATTQVCPNGQEPIIDYGVDCCSHFSCQPICSSAVACSPTPAPACPAGTKLRIGTFVEDCCPAFRCEPDGSCDPATGKCTCTTTSSGANDPSTCQCDASKAVCTLAMPYCGPNVMPVVVGQTPDCCPIYQCPCDATTNTGTTDPSQPPSKCGCTYPNCAPGEELVCLGANICGYPCTCQKAQGNCKADTDCAWDTHCELSNCYLAPTNPIPATGVAPALCKDATLCGPQLGMPTKLCPDGKTTAGPTGRCLALADGSCTWEVASCPATTCKLTDCGPALGMPNKLCPDGKTMSGPTSNCVVQPSGQCGWEFIDCPVPVDCYGICVPNVANGCKADTECPSGEKCEMACTASACAGSATDPTACTCPAGDRSCTCDANGNCGGQSCVGKCVPATPVCNAPVACPASIPACADGQKPVSTGTDPTTCCPIYQCPRCASTGPNGSTCPVPACICAKVTGTDATTCCPTYVCGQVDPTTNQCL